MAGTFQNVTMGNGILKINDVDVGFLSGGVVFRYNYDILDFKTGVPKTKRGSITKEIVAEITAPMAEIKAENVSAVLGGLAIVETAASEVDETLSFRSYTASINANDGMLYSIKIGPTANPALKVAVTDDASLSLYNVAETVAYVEGDDFIMDYSTGKAIFSPDGTNYANLASDSYIVKVKAKYTPPASKQINLGAVFSLADVKVEFEHTSPVTGKKINIVFWKANSNASSEINFDEENVAIQEVTLMAVYDESHPDNPMGYYYFET